MPAVGMKRLGEELAIGEREHVVAPYLATVLADGLFTLAFPQLLAGILGVGLELFLTVILVKIVWRTTLGAFIRPSVQTSMAVG